MKSDATKLIEQFEQKSIELEEYVSMKNSFRNETFNSKKSSQMVKSVASFAKKLIDTDINAFVKLLDNPNIVVAKSAAEYLYPLYPERCLHIMRTYKDTLTASLDVLSIDIEIQGYEKKQKFFMDNFKKMYNCEDLDSLNRER